MEKRIVRIFLASSIVELREERNELDAFLGKLGRTLREKYIDKGLYIDIVPIRCEDVDPAISSGRKQEEYNELINQCDFCVFLFFTKAGEYTVEEFDTALSAFISSGNNKPRIYTFFKRVDDNEAEKSVVSFMERLDKKLQHYYTIFDSIDTVKLQLLLHLSIQNSDYIEVQFENGKCYINDAMEMAVDSASQFANNQTLKDLASKLENVEQEYYVLKSGYPFEDDQKNKEYKELELKRQSIIKTIDQLKKEIFNMTLNICKDEASGKEITGRMREAYRLFEQGDLDGANKILNYSEIKNEYLNRKKFREDEQKNDDILYIRESRAKIGLLEADINNPDRFAEINEIYADAVSVAKDSFVELEIIYENALYLYNQNHLANAYKVAKELEEIYESNNASVQAHEKSELFTLLVVICSYQPSKEHELEMYVKKAMAITELLASEYPQKYSSNLAICHNNMSDYYKNHNDPQNAEKHAMKAIEIYEKLLDENSGMRKDDLADFSMCYNNAGNLFWDLGQIEKAEEYYLKALAIREMLATSNPERYSGDIAGSYTNVGNLYRGLGRTEKAENYLIKATELYEKLWEANPGEYSNGLAISYYNAAILYQNLNTTEKAIAYYRKAINIYKVLASENPERYSCNLADSYNNAGVLCMKQEQSKEAEEYFLKVLATYEKLASENPIKHLGDLADSYNNLGTLYFETNIPKMAKNYYLKAIKIYKRLMKSDPVYIAKLASIHYKLGIHTKNKRSLQKSVKLLKKQQNSEL